VTTWLRAPLGRLLRSELRWVLRRPRTQVALVLLALVPVVTGLGIAAAGSPASAGLLTQVAGNGLVLPVVALSICLTLLFPLAVAMAAADALAGESVHATLRGLLLAPISRSRLVLVKSIGVLAVAVAAVASVAVLGIVTGLILVGPASSTHGMLTLSMLTHLAAGASAAPPDPAKYEGVLMGINYGFNKVRFVNPVKVGSRIRARAVTSNVELKGNSIEVTRNFTIEIDGESKPALVAEWLTRTVYA